MGALCLQEQPPGCPPVLGTAFTLTLLLLITWEWDFPDQVGIFLGRNSVIYSTE
jgi:hypothetical protein